MNEKLATIWEVYERDGSSCALYLDEKDAKACDVFPNGYDKISKSTIYVSIGDLALLEAGIPVIIT